eukprot:3590723-Amphidinium_carterae.1
MSTLRTTWTNAQSQWRQATFLTFRATTSQDVATLNHRCPQPPAREDNDDFDEYNDMQVPNDNQEEA